MLAEYSYTFLETMITYSRARVDAQARTVAQLLKGTLLCPSQRLIAGEYTAETSLLGCYSARLRSVSTHAEDLVVLFLNFDHQSSNRTWCNQPLPLFGHHGSLKGRSRECSLLWIHINSSERGVSQQGQPVSGIFHKQRSYFPTFEISPLYPSRVQACQTPERPSPSNLESMEVPGSTL